VKVVGVTLGVNSIVCRVDSTGGVHFRSKCDCLKPREERNVDHMSETQNNRCDLVQGQEENADRHLVDASICSCDPRACLIYNWGDVGFGTM